MQWQKSLHVKMRTADTNLLVRALIKDPGAPEQSARAQVWLSAQSALFVPQVVQLELVESLKVRLREYYEKTRPLLEFYERRNQLLTVDANRNIEDIYLDIRRLLGLPAQTLIHNEEKEGGPYPTHPGGEHHPRSGTAACANVAIPW